MACGLPVITTHKVGSAGDLVKDGINGYLIDDKSSEQLYLAIKKIIADPERIRKMGQESWNIVKQFNIDNAVQVFYSAISYVRSGSHKKGGVAR